LSNLGKCGSVDNSKAALVAFEKAHKNKKPFDLMTLDVSMPEVSGELLLREIREREKEWEIVKSQKVKIIMVTSKMNTVTIKRCIKLGCNGYISKPFNKAQLFMSIEKLGINVPEYSKEDTGSQSSVVKEIIDLFNTGRVQLPVQSDIIQEIEDLLNSKNPSIEDLVKIIEKDVVISSKLVFIANTPLYKDYDKAEDLDTALAKIGMKATQCAVSAMVKKQLFTSGNKTLQHHLKKFWAHSFACACAGKFIAEELEMDNADTVFLMGVVHDIGKLFLIKTIVEMFPELDFHDEENISGIKDIHTTFGGAVLKKWGFSKDFIQIAELHHWSHFPKQTDEELLIINLANAISDVLGYDFFPAGDIQIKEDDFDAVKKMKSFSLLKMDPAKIKEIAERVKIVVDEAAEEF
ncbi:MAG: HDOD domain-containing protein, partial [Desulfobacteraceae bacterium]|nr:HDOD domain-containing protein [Desulfobacteraceae bacterium]